VAPSIQTLERLAKALGVSEASLLDDERALMEEFLAVLQQRGVTFDSGEQAVALGNAVADILAAFRSGERVTSRRPRPRPAMVGRWPRSASGSTARPPSSVRCLLLRPRRDVGSGAVRRRSANAARAAARVTLEPNSTDPQLAS